MIEFIKHAISPVRIITFVLTGVISYMWITGIVVPQGLEISWALITGYWFKTEADKK